MTGKLTVEVDERGFHMECCLLKVDDYDKAYLLYHIGKALQVDASDFSAIGELMALGKAENLFANGNTVEIDLSSLVNRNKDGETDV